MIWSFLTWIAGGYVLLVLVVYLAQSRLLYFPDTPTRDVTNTPASLGLEFESVQLTTEDGLVLDGWFVPQPEAKQVILFFHGNVLTI